MAQCPSFIYSQCYPCHHILVNGTAKDLEIMIIYDTIYDLSLIYYKYLFVHFLSTLKFTVLCLVVLSGDVGQFYNFLVLLYNV